MPEKKAKAKRCAKQTEPDHPVSEAGAPPSDGVVNTPYDDVFKALVLYCPSLLLLLLNELFGEHYTGKETVEHLNSEHFTTHADGTQEKHMTDSHFITVEEMRRTYVVECETNPDGAILLRIFGYGVQIMQAGATQEGNVLNATFPHIAIVALRSRKSTPEEMTVRVTFPNNETVSFNVPVFRVKDYTLNEIREKKLFFVLPFYLFTHEGRFPEYESDATKLRVLQDDVREIGEYLNTSVAQGELDEYHARLIWELMGKVADNLAAKYTKFKKGVREAMNGTEYVPQTVIMYREARDEAWRAGEAKGRREGEANIITRLLAGGMTPEQISDIIALPLAEVLALRGGA